MRNAAALCDYRALHYLADGAVAAADSAKTWWERVSPDGSRDDEVVRAAELTPFLQCANDAKDHRECCRQEGLTR